MDLVDGDVSTGSVVNISFSNLLLSSRKSGNSETDILLTAILSYYNLLIICM